MFVANVGVRNIARLGTKTFYVIVWEVWFFFKVPSRLTSKKILYFHVISAYKMEPLHKDGFLTPLRLKEVIVESER